jgi:hypothetical protein
MSEWAMKEKEAAAFLGVDIAFLENDRKKKRPTIPYLIKWNRFYYKVDNLREYRNKMPQKTADSLEQKKPSSVPHIKEDSRPKKDNYDREEEDDDPPRKRRTRLSFDDYGTEYDAGDVHEPDEAVNFYLKWATEGKNKIKKYRK